MQIEKQDDILARLKADDRNALQEIFNSYYPVVCKVIIRYVRDKSLTEDLAQEVFIRFWNKRHKIEINSSLGAYLKRMGVNEALGHLRSNKHFETDEFTLDSIKEVDESAEEQFLYGELKNHITTAINGLPPKCQTVFKMSRYDEMTYKEISAALGISIKTVENQMGKALRVLRSNLKQYI